MLTVGLGAPARQNPPLPFGRVKPPRVPPTDLSEPRRRTTSDGTARADARGVGRFRSAHEAAGAAPLGGGLLAAQPRAWRGSAAP